MASCQRQPLKMPFFLTESYLQSQLNFPLPGSLDISKTNCHSDTQKCSTLCLMVAYDFFLLISSVMIPSDLTFMWIHLIIKKAFILCRSEGSTSGDRKLDPNCHKQNDDVLPLLDESAEASRLTEFRDRIQCHWTLLSQLWYFGSAEYMKRMS